MSQAAEPFQDFIDALATELGIELEPDVDGWVGLDCGRGLEVLIGCVAATGTVVLLAPFRQLTPDTRDAWSRRALAFNLEDAAGGHGHFGLDAATDTLVFQREIPLTGLDAAGLLDLFAAFVARYRGLSDRFDRDDSPASGQTDHGGDPKPDFDPPGILRP